MKKPWESMGTDEVLSHLRTYLSLDPIPWGEVCTLIRMNFWSGGRIMGDYLKQSFPGCRIRLTPKVMGVTRVYYATFYISPNGEGWKRRGALSHLIVDPQEANYQAEMISKELGIDLLKPPPD
jgi:hypothetical protein